MSLTELDNTVERSLSKKRDKCAANGYDGQYAVSCKYDRLVRTKEKKSHIDMQHQRS